MDFNQILLLIIFLLILSIVCIGGLIFIYSKKRKGKRARALNMSLFLISLPKKTKRDEEKAPKTEKEIIAVMEQLYSSFNNIRETKDVFFYGQPHLSFEIATPETGEEINFYISMPRKYETVIEKQIHGFYSDASIKKVEDYNIFNPEGKTAGSYLKLAKSYTLPFKTYQDMEADPINGIVSALSKVSKEGEGVSVQLLIRPTLMKWQKSSRDIAKEMQQGKSFSQAKSSKGGNILGQIAKDLKKSKDNQSQIENRPIITAGQEEVIKAIESKASKVGFDVNLRLLVSAPDQNRADELLSHLESSFVQFEAPDMNKLKSVRIKKGRGLKNLIYDFSFRLFNQKNRMLFNTEELTSIFHFPTASTETPKVKFLKTEQASPPANMPKQGLILGKNDYRGVETVIRMQEDDRRRHLYVIGQTGTGKTVFMKNMILQDIKEGKGVCFVDPHGSDLESVMAQIPKERAEDVILIDPADMERPLGLNMMDYNAKYPEQKTFVVNELMSIFEKLYDMKASGGPMFEQYTRNALLLLMDDPNDKFTLMEVPKIMSDKEFRTSLLVKCKNIVVKDFWEKEAEKAGGEASLANMVPYITSKFNVFIANDYMRPIIGQSESSIDFRQIMDEQKILLVNLSKGRLGDINSYLLGLIIVGKLLMAALSRVDISEEERKDFYLYMDEFQNFSTNSIATILSEARKYKLCLIMGHQFIGQLTEEISKAVFGNVGSMVAFRVGAEDAEFLVKQFEPVFDANSLINIDNFNAHIKLMINNETSAPFSLATYPPGKEDAEIAKSIKELSHMKYGKDRTEVEKEITERWKSSISSNIQPSSPPESDVGVK